MQLAISTNQLVTFQLEDDIFGIDIMLTQEILKLIQLRKIPNSPYYFEGMLNLRGEVIPVINFKKLFTFGTFDLSKDKGIIISKVEDQRFGIVIDKILRVIQFEHENIKQVPEGFSRSLKQYILGVVEQQDDLVAILDIQAIFQVTSKELARGGQISNYVLDFRRDKLESLSIVEEKVIIKFIETISYKLNPVTDIGVFGYFSKEKIKTNLSIGELIKEERKRLESDGYSPFKIEKTDKFFDNDEDFLTFLSLLEHLIIPRKEQESIKTLRVVNLGCGSGEELYSLLLILFAFIPNFDKWKVKLVGVESDFNKISIAQKGIFTKNQVERINKKDLTTYFDKLEDGNYQIKKMLRDRVDFRFGTPKNYEKISDIDLFFCRGVFSQLNMEEIDQLLYNISESLNNFGLLVLNRIEDLFRVNRGHFLAREINGQRYYVKKAS